jgi:threonine/homoserine/homoserine lactone efflux protein
MRFLNPKLTIFFLAFLPQFVDPAAGQPLVQLLLLSVVFMAITSSSVQPSSLRRPVGAGHIDTNLNWPNRLNDPWATS